VKDLPYHLSQLAVDRRATILWNKAHMILAFEAIKKPGRFSFWGE
jgi:hypothetical protein